VTPEQLAEALHLELEVGYWGTVDPFWVKAVHRKLDEECVRTGEYDAEYEDWVNTRKLLERVAARLNGKPLSPEEEDDTE
jgi:hypothetical protein